MRQASVKIIESLPQLGGQLSALYPEKYIYDVAGFPKVRALELANNLKEQMDQFKPAVALEQAVEKVEKQADGVFRLTTNSEVHYSKTIIITAGNGAFKPRKIELENQNSSSKRTFIILWIMNKFKGRKVLYAGAGILLRLVSYLKAIAEKVTLTHRRDKFRAHEHSVENLHNSSVDIKTPYVPVQFVGDDRITQVVLENTKGEEKTVVDVDDVIVNFGFVSSLGPIKEWDLDLEKNAIAINQSKKQTFLASMQQVMSAHMMEK